MRRARYALALSMCSSFLLCAGSTAVAGPITIGGTTTGTFVNPAGGVVSGVGTSFFQWGVPLGTPPSSLRFSGASFSTTIESGFIFGPRPRADRDVFSLGTLEYFNGTVQSGTGANAVTQRTTVTVTTPVGTNPGSFDHRFNLVNTPNSDDPIASADFVHLPTSFSTTTLTTPSGAPLTLELLGFGSVTGSGFTTVDQFHVLEGGSASASVLGRFAPPCEPIVSGAVTTSVTGGITMSASFQPNFGLTLLQAAGLCGYDHFNWYQQITEDPNPPGGQTVPYVDPPPGGGPAFGGFADSKPFYWDEEGPTGTGYHLSDNYDTLFPAAGSLFYSDTPAESSLTGSQKLSFTTSLVGVLPDGSWDALYAWSWSSNYTGVGGGVTVRRTRGTEPGGTGGIFDIQLDLNPEDITEEGRALMLESGARNVAQGPLTPVPEPSTLALLACGSSWLLSRRARRRVSATRNAECRRGASFSNS